MTQSTRSTPRSVFGCVHHLWRHDDLDLSIAVPYVMTDIVVTSDATVPGRHEQP